jgi:hypothetical protein
MQERYKKISFKPVALLFLTDRIALFTTRIWEGVKAMAAGVWVTYRARESKKALVAPVTAHAMTPPKPLSIANLHFARLSAAP